MDFKQKYLKYKEKYLNLKNQSSLDFPNLIGGSKIDDHFNRRCACKICGIIPSKLCSRCLNICYCARAHQAQDWPRHKLECKPADVTRLKEFSDVDALDAAGYEASLAAAAPETKAELLRKARLEAFKLVHKELIQHQESAISKLTRKVNANPSDSATAALLAERHAAVTRLSPSIEEARGTELGLVVPLDSPIDRIIQEMYDRITRYIIRLSIRSGAHIPNMVDREGSTILISLCKRKESPLIESLAMAIIEAGEDVNIAGNEGITPLQILLRRSGEIGRPIFPRLQELIRSRGGR